MNFTTLHVETAAKSENSICRISVMDFKDNEILKSYDWILQPPNNKYDKKNLNTTLTEEDTVNSPSLYDVWEDIEDVLNRKTVISYNANFNFDCIISSFKYYCQKNIKEKNSLLKESESIKETDKTEAERLKEKSDKIVLKSRNLNCTYICLSLILRRLFTNLNTLSLNELYSNIKENDNPQYEHNSAFQTGLIFQKVLSFLNISDFMALSNISGITFGFINNSITNYKRLMNKEILTTIGMIKETAADNIQLSSLLSESAKIIENSENLKNKKLSFDFGLEKFPCFPTTDTQDFRKYDFKSLTVAAKPYFIPFKNEADKLERLLDWGLITKTHFKKINKGKEFLKTFKYKGIKTNNEESKCDVVGYTETNNYQTLVIKINFSEYVFINIDYFAEMQHDYFKANTQFYNVDSSNTKAASERHKGKNIKKLSCCFPPDYCLFDIETTSKYNMPDEDIIEIAAVKVRDNTVVDEFSSLISLNCQTENKTENINHISLDMLEDAPPLENVLYDFFQFIGDDILVGHNINSFDINWINDRAIKYNLLLSNDYIDTLYLSNALLQGLALESHSAEYLAYYFGIDYSNAHRALEDCYIEYEIYNKLSQIEYTDIKTSVKKENHNHNSHHTAAYNDLSSLNWSCFSDKYVAITGNLRLTRNKEAIFAEIEKFGGYKDISLTKKCNYLISADSNPDAKVDEFGIKESSKLKKAKINIEKGLDTKILSEKEFYKMIGYEEILLE